MSIQSSEEHQENLDFEARFFPQLSLIKETKKLLNQLAVLLHAHNDKDQFFTIAYNFNLLASDISRSVILCIKDGQIAAAIVLMRWYLEIAHLCYYLWQNPDKRNEWLAGKQIKPKDIRKFIKSCGYATWGESYFDWSNFVHGNAPFILQYTGFRDLGEKKEDRDILCGNIFINVLFLTHKLNHIFGKALQAYVVEYYENIVSQYNQIEEAILLLTKTQWENEEKFMRG